MLSSRNDTQVQDWNWRSHDVPALEDELSSCAAVKTSDTTSVCAPVASLSGFLSCCRPASPPPTPAAELAVRED